MKTLALLAVFLPLAGFVLAGLPIVAGRAGHGVDRWAQLSTSLCVGIAALASIALFMSVGIGHQPANFELFTWIDSGAFEASWPAIASGTR